jgi:hypothetical protein
VIAEQMLAKYLKDQKGVLNQRGNRALHEGGSGSKKDDYGEGGD